MALPVPNLDDRRFQDLVDDAKRLVQQRCPEWTDHNVSDPGVTLIELFAWMTDQVLYRLNRVPDKHYVKFLELVGVRLFPPTAARADVTFWLSAPQPEAITVPRGTEVATARTPTEEAIPFSTIEDLVIVPVTVAAVASMIEEGSPRDHTGALAAGHSFFCFDEVPKPGDALLIGLSSAVAGCAVSLRFDCDIEGVGVNPLNPPTMWEAWDGEGWIPVAVASDETGGLNSPGDIVLHVPREHTTSLIGNQLAGWIRCRVVDPDEGQPAYGASPRIKGVTAFTTGGTAQAVNAEEIRDEIIGTSEGVAGQRFGVKRPPIIRERDSSGLEASGPEGWVEWVEVVDFADSSPEDRHYVLDPVAGEIQFGPAVREPDGTLTQRGAVPPKGASLRLKSYRTGGGRRGNVAQSAIRVLKSTIPFIARVENARPARGGVDGEDIDNAKTRGAILLKTGTRAVTAEDYESLAHEAAPEIARIRCLTVDEETPGAVRVLVVPAVSDQGGRLRFEQLKPSPQTVERIARYLDDRRVIGARVLVEPPTYQGITIVARIRAKAQAAAERVQTDAVEALYEYFHPVRGGPDGEGWPFGRPVHVGEVYSVLQTLRGSEYVQEARLFKADPITGQRGRAVERIELRPNDLVFSYRHQVVVET